MMRKPDPLIEMEMRASLNATIALMEEAREQLMEVAFQGNLSREHHFHDANLCFEQINALWKAQRTLEGLFGEGEPESKKMVEIVTYDPRDEETYPSVCVDPGEVEERFGFTGGEKLVFDSKGNYLGRLVARLP